MNLRMQSGERNGSDNSTYFRPRVTREDISLLYGTWLARLLFSFNRAGASCRSKLQYVSGDLDLEYVNSSEIVLLRERGQEFV